LWDEIREGFKFTMHDGSHHMTKNGATIAMEVHRNSVWMKAEACGSV
jgi:hypothetical protein